VTYVVKEIYSTLQGEGRNTGREAVLCRFAGCNLWTGLERDRATAICKFCDTSFRGTDGPGGGRFRSAEDLADAIARRWAFHAERFVVLTGGEPTLQLDDPLLDALHDRDFEVAIETNGTRPVPEAVDWICVSPKAGAPLQQRSGDELKLVFPQRGAPPDRFVALDFEHFYLQPMDGPNLRENTRAARRYCREHPRWALSLQAHKLWGLP
jgi:7-carboxy-7-deazaguanine synthase